MLPCAPAIMAITIPTITVRTGLESGSGDIDNVLYQNSTGIAINANINSTGYVAIFTSTTSLDSGGGQAMLDAETAGYLNNLAFALTDGASFTRLYANLDMLKAAQTAGTIVFTVDYTSSALSTFTSNPFAVTWNSQNKPTIFATGGARMSKVTWNTTLPTDVGVEGANQYRFGGLRPAGNVLDSGSTIILLRIGFGLIGFLERRK